jgi:hypothetical protein
MNNSEARFIIPSIESLGEMFVGIVESLPQQEGHQDNNRIEVLEEEDITSSPPFQPQIHTNVVEFVTENVKPQQQMHQEQSYLVHNNVVESVKTNSREPVQEPVIEDVVQEEEEPVQEPVIEEVVQAEEEPVQEPVIEEVVQAEEEPVPKPTTELVFIQESFTESTDGDKRDACPVQLLEEKFQEMELKTSKRGKRGSKSVATAAETSNKRVRRNQKKSQEEDDEIDINDL